MVSDHLSDLVNTRPGHRLTSDRQEDVPKVQSSTPLGQAGLLHALNDDGLGVIASEKSVDIITIFG